MVIHHISGNADDKQVADIRIEQKFRHNTGIGTGDDDSIGVLSVFQRMFANIRFNAAAARNCCTFPKVLNTARK